MLRQPRPLTAAPTWRDNKRWWWLLSAIFPGLIWSHLFKYQETGQIAWLWLMSVVTYVVVPLLDGLLGPDTSNPPEEALADLEQQRWYQVLLLVFVPLQYGLTMHGAWLVAHQTQMPGGSLGLLGWLGLILTVGGVNGIAINTAHELGHKQPAWQRWLARITLAPVAYGHFFVEHNRGHHRRVATLEDPASARMGESFWAFLPRSMIGSLRSAWALERARLKGHRLPAWHWRNQCLQAWAMTLLFYAALCLWLGLGVLPFLLIQAFYGASLLEVVNYIEHYGLLRALGPDGRPVRCEPEHSWNSNHRVSNLFLFHLQRHSDHHAHPTRPYQALRHFESSPQLPTGYAGLLLLAYLPPLWFRLMDPKVLAHYGGDISRANLQPSRRTALLRRYAKGVELRP
ncbi:alkane 1-monooxygenase [Paucibacter sp. AS339]|uniref:alkane 1-monooxygenase n=1 Tax=Paucibacter hankyongi TaxID=3133434 RepID=UPI0030A0AA50